MAGRQETALERQAKMRERARTLREKREAERLALVEKKLDQRWRLAAYRVLKTVMYMYAYFYLIFIKQMLVCYV